MKLDIKNKIQKFVNKTKDPLSYISDVKDFILNLWGIFAFLLFLFSDSTLSKTVKEYLSNLPIFLKFLFILLMIGLFYYLLNDAYKKIRFIYESKELSKNLQAKAVNQARRRLIGNYKNIIPSTFILRETTKIFEKRAKKWASDSYLSRHKLMIWIRQDKIDAYLQCRFFSKKKKLTVEFQTTGMKVPKKSHIEVSQLHHDESSTCEKPIYLEKKWRKFVVEGLERLENKIAGRELYISVGRLGGVLQFYVDPHFTPQRSFSFYLYKGIIYKDISCRKKIAEL